jgi:hypothetical protein
LSDPPGPITAQMNRAHPARQTSPEILVSVCPLGHLPQVLATPQQKSNNELKCNAIFEASHDRYVPAETWL